MNLRSPSDQADNLMIQSDGRLLMLLFFLTGRKSECLAEYSPLLAALAHARQDMEEKQLIRQ